MCGIVGYIGDKDINSVLMAGLWRLEYRGYDSSGVASVIDGEMEVRKVKGRLMNLQELLAEKPLSGTLGIGHTRWATHGEPSDQNAHPQVGCKNMIAVVHNGIIENYYSLKEELVKRKHFFKSNTDTEVIAHLIEENYEGDLKKSVLETISRLEGSFAIAVICTEEPDKIVVYRYGSPLTVGIGKNENLIASDIPALLDHTKDVITMSDGELGVITKDKTEAMQLAAVLENENYERRKIDVDTFDEAMQLVENSLDLDNEMAIILHQEEWHPGVIGIVASRLVEKYYRPTIMLTTIDGVAKGSARSISNFDIYEALQKCEDSLIHFGGHKAAAGLAIEIEKLNEFKERFNEVVRTSIK
ncbi:MAG: DHHA1 domain-containing protein, partial [candidate division WOR-3 bacterium]